MKLHESLKIDENGQVACAKCGTTNITVELAGCPEALFLQPVCSCEKDSIRLEDNALDGETW